MKKKNQKYVTKTWNIYMLRSPKEKKYCVAYCLEGSLKEIYRHDIKLRREHARPIAEASLPDRPCLFLLETVTCNQNEATRYLIVWIKLLNEQGYTCMNREVLREMSEDLTLDSMMLYLERKNVDLTQLLTCEHCCVKTYGRVTCPYFSEE